ncbi:MAG: sugar ABC transporter permease [Ruminococcaceae bacterium]|nr:sugar ABC transporter permease [Oscillospiraceae bacterium]
MNNKKQGLSYKNKRALAGLLFTLPWIIGFLAFFFRPLAELFMYSVSTLRVEIGHLDMKFTGFEHYKNIFISDEKFLPMLYTQLTEMLYRIPVIIAFSLFIAILLNNRFHGRTIVRAIFFIPVIAGSGGIVMSIMNGDVMSESIMSGGRTGMLFQSFSFQQVLLESGVSNEVIDIYMGIVSGIFELTWQSGLQIVLFIAALQNISPQLYEAARVEGATAWEGFWNITFPLITPILIVNLIYTIIDFLSDYSNNVIQYIMTLIGQFEYSYSSAISFIYFLVVLIVVSVVYFIVDRVVVYTVN